MQLRFTVHFIIPWENYYCIVYRLPNEAELVGRPYQDGDIICTNNNNSNEGPVKEAVQVVYPEIGVDGMKRNVYL